MVEAHLTGEIHLGLHPLLTGDTCHWLAADFDGPSAMLDALAADGPLLVVATGPYVGEGFDCPALDTVFLAAPIAFKGRLVQYVGRVLRPVPGKHVVEVHDYHDVQTAILASSLRKRASGYTSLGFPDPRTTRHQPPPRSG